MLEIFKTRSLVAIVSLLMIGAALSIGVAKADDVTEDQILRALAPAKKPLTRGLSTGPQTQTDPPPGGFFARPQTPTRPRRSRGRRATDPEPAEPAYALALGDRARGNRHHCQGQAEDRSGNQLRL